MNNEIALKWTNERLAYIRQNCNLEDEHNKKVFDVLTYIEKILENQEVKK